MGRGKHCLGDRGQPWRNGYARRGTARLVDARGNVFATARIRRLKAPLDLTPKTAVVILTVPAGVNLYSEEVRVDCG